jgi:hypothetical protein
LHDLVIGGCAQVDVLLSAVAVVLLIARISRRCCWRGRGGNVRRLRLGADGQLVRQMLAKALLP